ncbi:MAG: hypothetical protein ABIO39_01630 [Caulobacteraceae bacterium]
MLEGQSTGLPRIAVSIAAAAIVIMAVLGGYFGWRRSLPTGDPESLPLQLGSNARVTNAKALTDPLFDEDQIRRIAREEVQAALAPRAAPRKTEATETEGPALSPPLAPPAPVSMAPSAPPAPVTVAPLSPDLR